MAVGGQATRDGRAYAARSTRDQGDGVGELGSVHEKSPSCLDGKALLSDALA